jgi:dsRNA-specific ribonuclease
MEEITTSKYPDIVREERLESIINYNFRDPSLRTRAITRKAYVNDMGPTAADGRILDNEALATLGDGVIDLIVLTFLEPEHHEKGPFTQAKEDYVNHDKLTKIAVADDVNLMNCMLIGNCETWTDGQGPGESLESVIGAIYLDCYKSGHDGIKVCEAVLEKIGLFDIVNKETGLPIEIVHE